jgi:actin-related protein
MVNDVRQNIKNLEKDILKTEYQIEEFIKFNYDQGIKNSIRQLEHDIKYLSILANGAPLDKNEDQELMNFLRTHYAHLQKFSFLV